MQICEKCGCEIDDTTECCPGCMTQVSDKPALKNNIIMWSEPDPLQRAKLIDALQTATKPIQDAMEYFEWEGEHLTCGPETLNNHKEEWRNLYFYLSGYGDSQFQYSLKYYKQQPVGIPTAATGKERQE